jgi:hypothetical protein
VLSTGASQSFDGGQTWQGLGAGGDNHGLWIDPKDSKHMKSDVSGDVKIRIYAGSRVVGEMDGPKTAGVNTVRWNLQMQRERVPGEAVPTGGRGGRGGGGAAAFGGAAQSPAPSPGFVSRMPSSSFSNRTEP